MKFGKTNGTEGLLKLAKFGVATLMFGDIRPQRYLDKQPKHARPVMHWLLANAYVFLHCVSKNIPDVFSYNSREHCPIFIIFGRNITKKASNQKMLYFSTLPD